MKSHLRWALCAAFLPIAACSSTEQTAATSPAPPPAPTLASVDQDFVTKAAQGGMSEVQLAQLALKKTHSATVKKFADKMIADHTPNNQQLMQLATQKNATVPSSVSDEEKEKMTKLQGESGTKFNRDYLTGEAKDHEEMLALMEQEASGGQDPELKKFAEETAPVVKTHIAMAQKMTSMGQHKEMHHQMRHHDHHGAKAAAAGDSGPATAPTEPTDSTKP